MTDGPVEEAPARRSGRLLYRMAGEIVPNFWEPGLIDGILETHGMTIVYGPSGSGKTAVVVDMACRIASGLPWRDRQVQQGLVVYVAAENPQSTERRIWAWQQRYKQEELPLAVVESPVAMNEAGVKELVALVKAVQEETGQDPRLIVMDTLARTMPGNENETKDMSEYVRWADELKSVTGAHLAVVHHTGKDESRGARGSSALKAATDHEIEIFKESGSAHGGMKLSKVREGDLEGTIFGFELERRDLGVNRLGRMCSTIIAVEADPPVRTTDKAAGLVQDIDAYIRGQGGRVTPEELRTEFGQLSAGKPASDTKAWKRLFSRHYRVEGSYILIPETRAGQVAGQDTP